MMKAIVVSAVGPNAAGKTAVLEALSQKGYLILRDDYPQLDTLGLDHRTIISKWRWIAGWYEKVITSARKGESKIITDRSPFDSAGHLADGVDTLVSMILQSNEELLRLEGIATRTVYLHSTVDTILRRVATRLQTEPWRAKYQEDSEDELRRRWAWYSNRREMWDRFVDVAGLSPSTIADEFESLLLLDS